ncbi:uncharacterized protein LOC120258010 [Dioscorea cayenensis subsp. rotundata]|uniref:Uncharacterized protein LOC120258010 n=1 Tax=Dioscorea cayennensis subsp. rotundata TaxID=55577 RepID=A0AB40B1W1_DIOCR|nr:uncharacterized protein LOC120258010 [Dioscorea cayenensis subsp. rotundata]
MATQNPNENQQMSYASPRAKLETFRVSQHLLLLHGNTPQPPNLYLPSINGQLVYARMAQGVPGAINLSASVFNNSSNGALRSESNEREHDTLPVRVQANEILNTQNLTPFPGNVPNYLTAPSDNNSIKCHQQQQQQQQQHQQQQQ